MKDLKVNTRIIAATNRDLKKAIKDGTFRNDLYYRLQVIPIALPTLKERKEDIQLIANHFISVFNKEFKKKVKPIGREVRLLFEGYSWPGNVRELKNMIERAILLEADEKLLPEHLPPEIGSGEESGEISTEPENLDALFPISLKEVERIMIEKTLKETTGNKSKAARILGISRQTLREKTKLYQLDS